ncbi:hypothetical protein ACW95P_02165 [Candidatus Mycoplasma pogonae]
MGSFNSFLDHNFPYYYELKNAPQGLLNNFAKLELKSKTEAVSEEYFLNGWGNNNLFLNLAYSTNYKWDAGFYNAKELGLVNLKFGQIKQALNAMTEELLKDPSFTNSEINLSDELVKNLINNMLTNHLITNLISQKDLELVKIAIENKETQTHKNNILKYKQIAIQKVIADLIFYLISKLAINGNKTLIYFEILANNTNNLNSNEIINNISRKVLLAFNPKNNTSNFVSGNNIIAIGVSQTYYHVWISIVVIAFLIVVFNATAFYRYGKIDVS